MSIPQKNVEYRYTYADYLTWSDDERWEIIDGVAYAMDPAPGTKHQRMSGRFFALLFNFLNGKPCEAFHAPFDVRLSANEDDDTVVQPDIVVVCDRSKLDDKGCKGAPDLVIEILSPSTARHDKLIKFNAYQRAGVREYWIADPDSKTLSVHVLEIGRYITSAYGDTDIAPVSVLPGCGINLSDVFAEVSGEE